MEISKETYWPGHKAKIRATGHKQRSMLYLNRLIGQTDLVLTKNPVAMSSCRPVLRANFTLQTRKTTLPRSFVNMSSSKEVLKAWKMHDKLTCNI